MHTLITPNDPPFGTECFTPELRAAGTAVAPRAGVS